MNIKMNYYEIDGKRYVDMLPPGVEVICDFCSSQQHPFRLFSAGDIEIDEENVSEGGWMACKACESFIDKHDFEGLRNRIIETFSSKYPGLMTPEEIEPIATHILDKFQLARRNLK